MLEFRITGNDAYELCTQMATLAQILDLATHPWENPEVKAAIEKSNSEKAKKEPVKEEAKPADPVKKPEPTKTEEKPKGKTISDEELRAAYADDPEAREKTKAYLRSHKLKSVAAIPQEDRQAFLAEVKSA